MKGTKLGCETVSKQRSSGPSLTPSDLASFHPHAYFCLLHKENFHRKFRQNRITYPKPVTILSVTETFQASYFLSSPAVMGAVLLSRRSFSSIRINNFSSTMFKTSDYCISFPSYTIMLHSKLPQLLSSHFLPSSVLHPQRFQKHEFIDSSKVRQTYHVSLSFKEYGKRNYDYYN